MMCVCVCVWVFGSLYLVSSCTSHKNAAEEVPDKEPTIRDSEELLKVYEMT